METYLGLTKRQQEEISNFKGLFFAFNNEQFNEGLKKIGFSKEKGDKVVSIGAGGFLLKSTLEDFININKRHKKELKQMRKDQKALINGLAYELHNHEYCITGDTTEALECLGLTVDSVDKNTLKKAIQKHNETVIY